MKVALACLVLVACGDGEASDARARLHRGCLGEASEAVQGFQRAVHAMETGHPEIAAQQRAMAVGRMDAAFQFCFDEPRLHALWRDIDSMSAAQLADLARALDDGWRRSDTGDLLGGVWRGPLPTPNER